MKIRKLGRVAYETAYSMMRDFHGQRTAASNDEIWLLEHPSVYTLGLSGNRRHLLNTGTIPVIETDRGGQVSYHGYGQLIAYLLIDLSRRPYTVKRFVTFIEQAVIDCLSSIGISGERKENAPGVYVDGKKIAALGVRIKKGGAYHGLALNVDMDLSPFAGINPCGYVGMQCTQLSEYITGIDINDAGNLLLPHLLKYLDVERPQSVA